MAAFAAVSRRSAEPAAELAYERRVLGRLCDWRESASRHPHGSIMRISKYMTAKLITARPEDGSRTTFFKMREHDIRHIPVVNDAGALVGIISDRDLRRPSWVDQAPDLAHIYHLDDEMRVGDLMTPSPITVHTYDTLHRAVELFLEHRFGCLPVLDKTGALVGIVSPLDLLRAFEDLEGKALRERKESRE
jgi:acetoin utilization protein AcuB